MIFESYSEKDTFDIGISIAKTAAAGSIFALLGDLGAGKTALAKGFAKGLSIEQAITSPTFSILNIYDGCTPTLYHFDLYRIKNINELYDIGYYEYIDDNGICLIEWANVLDNIIPQSANIIELVKGDNDYRRIILR